MAKAALTEAQRETMAAATHGAALVLLDDLKHIRRIVGLQEPDPGDLRRLSNLLRRILVEGDLRKIATPRMGKIGIVAPDLRALYYANDERPFHFVAADSFNIHGYIFSAVIMEAGPRERALPNFRPDDRATLSIEPFQNQKVLCFEGQWVTRADLIKYVANVAHGTHSGTPKNEVARRIRLIRSALRVQINSDDGVPEIGFNWNALVTDDGPIQFRPDVIDLALLSLISTAQFLTTSPDVFELERIIATSG